MGLSIFLARILGLFILIKGISLLTKRKEIENIIEDVYKEKTLLMFAGGFELLFGLFLVSIHSVWVNAWPVVITILAWVMVIEGICIAVLPMKKMTDIFKVFTTKRWITIWTIVTLAIGVYLTNAGFGWW